MRTPRASGVGWGASFLLHVGIGVACYFAPVGSFETVSPKPPDTPPLLEIRLVRLREPAPVAAEVKPLPPEPVSDAVEPFPPPEVEPPATEEPPPEPPALKADAPRPVFAEEPVALEPLAPVAIELGLGAEEPPEPPAEAPPPQRPSNPPPEAQDKPASEPAAEERAAVVSPAECAHNPPPGYPRVARRRGYEGLVVVLARVSRGGTCLAVEVKRSSGHAVLDAAAAAAVRKWRFKPATLDGVPVEAEVEVPIRFRLAG